MFDVLRIRDEVDQLYGSLNGGDRFFEPVFAGLPTFVPAELGFIRAVSYIYSLYREAGRPNVEIAMSYFPVYDINDGSPLDNHFDVVDRLRTYMQHNLSPFQKREAGIRKSCEDWFKASCNTRIPSEESHWQNATSQILKDSAEFLRRVVGCLRRIENDESSDLIVERWKQAKKRKHQPKDFDEIIHLAAVDMGRENLNVIKFRRRYYPKWMKDLESLSFDYDFAFEARRLVEAALLFESQPLLPITGSDVINALGIEPGLDTELLLRKAATIVDGLACSSEELLIRLREYTELAGGS
jgi:hypothetical protein